MFLVFDIRKTNKTVNKNKRTKTYIKKQKQNKQNSNLKQYVKGSKNKNYLNIFQTAVHDIVC